MRESDFNSSMFNGAYLEKAVAYKANFSGPDDVCCNSCICYIHPLDHLNVHLVHASTIMPTEYFHLLDVSTPPTPDQCFCLAKVSEDKITVESRIKGNTIAIMSREHNMQAECRNKDNSATIMTSQQHINQGDNDNGEKESIKYWVSKDFTSILQKTNSSPVPRSVGKGNKVAVMSNAHDMQQKGKLE
ncbi:Thylakoid lumenal protein, chloroplastic [Capsicum chinense]|nr:Thylakoid lumenal protein, chloroplastic [Capsicum chinense]